MLTRETFTGPWAGLPVPWTEDDRFDEATYRQDVARCCEAGVPGVYSGGTTGEFYAMELDEFRAVAKATVEESHARNVPAMVGCTSTYTLGAVRRASYAAEIGADAVQIALPFWMEMADHEVVPFYRAIADAIGDLPVSVYETRRAKKALTLEQHRAIKEAVPSYLMVKSNANTLGHSVEGCRALSEFVNVFVGEDVLSKLGQAGARGSCSSLVYYNPRVILDLWRNVENEEWEAADAICAKMDKFFEAIGAYLEGRNLLDAAVDRLGGYAGGFLKCNLRSRGPYSAPTEADAEWQRNYYRENWPEMLEF
jgi:4-hydroxy-tetrahydrodipicolinate synthase